jgi:hypothetical protein
MKEISDRRTVMDAFDPKGNMKPRIFLSYAKEDISDARTVYDALQNEGLQPYIDERDLDIGDNWKEEIRDSIEQCGLFVACLSKRSIEKEGHVQFELKVALEFSETKPNRSAYILPLLLDECSDTMPRSLRALHYLRWFKEDDRPKFIRGVKKRIEAKEPEAKAGVEKPPSDIDTAVDVSKALYQLFGADEDTSPDHVRELIANVGTLVGAVTTLQQRRDWANDRYINFISGLLNSVIDLNVERIKSLPQGGDWTLVFPRTAAEMADDVLSEQMKAMDAGDSYDVISDVASWHNSQLEKLQAETLSAVKRGVNIRRVFNLLRPSWHEEYETDRAKLTEILKLHFHASSEWESTRGGRYEIKVMDDKDLSKRELARFDRAKVVESHFGVFRHGPGGTAVRFKVLTPSLSEMLLCRDAEIIKKDLTLFEAVWAAGSWLKDRRELLSNT